MKLIIKEQIWRRLLSYARASAELNVEVQGWGKAEWNGEDLILSQLYPLPKQTGNGVNTKIEPDSSMTKYVMEANLHWHTHPKMGAFFSGTDVEDIKNILKGRTSIISLVLNEKGEIKGRLDYTAKVKIFNKEKMRQITEELVIDIQDEILEEVLDEVKSKVKKYEISPYYSYYSKYKKEDWYD